jgi:PhnB protein
MPKRSLNPSKGGPSKLDQKKIEQLNRAVEGMLARSDGRLGKVDVAIEPLVRVAAELRNLPNASFKARLKSDLEGKKRMSTVLEQPKTSEPYKGVRNTASPNLSFREPAKAIEFYTKALGAKETFRFEIGGQIPHAEILIGGSTINLAGEWPEGGRFSAETLGFSPVSISIQVGDADSFVEHAVEAGMKIVRPLRNQFYGIRDATLSDPFGYSWNIRQVIEELSVEEMHRRHGQLRVGPEGGQMRKEPTGVSPVPRGFRTVTPYLVAADGLALLEFTKQAFGAEETERVIMPTGVHAEVRMGDSPLMMAAASRARSSRARCNRRPCTSMSKTPTPCIRRRWLPARSRSMNLAITTTASGRPPSKIRPEITGTSPPRRARAICHMDCTM